MAKKKKTKKKTAWQKVMDLEDAVRDLVSEVEEVYYSNEDYEGQLNKAETEMVGLRKEIASLEKDIVALEKKIAKK